MNELILSDITDEQFLTRDDGNETINKVSKSAISSSNIDESYNKIESNLSNVTSQSVEASVEEFFAEDEDVLQVPQL